MLEFLFPEVIECFFVAIRKETKRIKETKLHNFEDEDVAVREPRFQPVEGSVTCNVVEKDVSVSKDNHLQVAQLRLLWRNQWT